MKRLYLVVIAGIGMLVGMACSKTNSQDGGEGSRLNGGGSSFVNPVMVKWAQVYDKEQKVKIDYSSTGSGNGVQQMIAKTIDFGCSDAPMNDEQLKKADQNGGPVVHIPLAMGGVVPAYNLPELKGPIRFSGPVLASIFLGKVTKWNDSVLKDLNPNEELPDRDISVVHRSDGSGTTYIWVDYLSKVSSEWKENVGVGTTVKWPCGVGQKGNEGVAGQISRSPGSLGYVELIYALNNKIEHGAVKNKDGNFVQADLETVTAAARGALTDIPDDFRYSLTNASGPEAYPISGTVWAVFYENQAADKGPALIKFLRWVIHDGQPYARDLHYAQLPEELVKKIDEKLGQVKTGSR